MKTISIRFNHEESELFTSYAKMKGVPLSTLMKKVFEEKIEDELDLETIRKYEKELNKGKIKTFSFDEVKKEVLG